MSDSFVQLRVVYQDLPSMVELAIEVCHEGWSAHAGIYVSPTLLTDDAMAIVEWSRDPRLPLRFGSGVSPGAGGFVMEFRTVDAARHVQCTIELVTRQLGRDRPRQVILEMPTELGLVERFGKECIALGKTLNGEATLIGLSA